MRRLRSLLLPLLCLAAAPALHAQAAPAFTDFVSAPGGGRLATLRSGASLSTAAARDGWREATLTGWLPEADVRQGGGGNYPLVVTRSAALRADPGGLTVATLAGGMVVAQVERRDGWVRIRRSGFVRDGGSTAPPAAAPAAVPPKPAPAQAAANAPKPASAAPARPSARPVGPPAPVTTPGSARSSGTGSASPSTLTRPAPARPAAPQPPASRPVVAAAARAAAAPIRPAAAPVRPPTTVRPAAPAARPAPVSAAAPARKQPVVLHAAPGGGTVAVVDADAPVQVLARDGEWTRVRVEGWTRSPVSSATTAPGAVTLRAIDADPDAFRGREVEWTLRFVSLQVADQLRTDFTPGESFILARDPNGETGFVYVAVAPELVGSVRRLAPFQQFRISGRIRVGRSPMMGHPIVDLVRLL